jgi:hypothetical protein
MIKPNIYHVEYIIEKNGMKCSLLKGSNRVILENLEGNFSKAA